MSKDDKIKVDGMDKAISDAVGAIVTHSGKVLESVFEGQNVWEPGAVGINFWKEITV